jgi:ribonuclease P protein component
MSIPREHRLRKHAEFELVYRNGKRHFSKLLTAFYVARDNDDEENKSSEVAGRDELGKGCRIGITVGRVLGTSTARNRIKRRVRSAIRENLAKITRDVDVVINPKKAVLEAEYRTLCSELARAFDAIEENAVAEAREQVSNLEGARRDGKRARAGARKT